MGETPPRLMYTRRDGEWWEASRRDAFSNNFKVFKKANLTDDEVVVLQMCALLPPGCGIKALGVHRWAIDNGRWFELRRNVEETTNG